MAFGVRRIVKADALSLTMANSGQGPRVNLDSREQTYQPDVSLRRSWTNGPRSSSCIRSHRQGVPRLSQPSRQRAAERGEIAKAVQIRRMEAYRIIKRLADSGVVVATPGNPVKYTGEPIEQSSP